MIGRQATGCVVCGDEPPNLKGGRCPACYAYRYRNGVDRPAGWKPQRRNGKATPEVDVLRECCECERMLPAASFGASFRSAKPKTCSDCRGTMRERAERGVIRPKHRLEFERALAARCANYGITCEDYQRLVTEQGGACGICQTPAPYGALSIDHDHQTGLVRGLLCKNCNTALGKLGDTLESVSRALAYLRRSVVVTASDLDS